MLRLRVARMRDLVERGDFSRDGGPRQREGRQLLQDVHGLQRRLHAQRRPHVPRI